MKKYKAGEFADAVGVSPDTLRDWRRRGIGLGGASISMSHEDRGSGNVTYTDIDVVAVHVMRFMQKNFGFELLYSYNRAKYIAPVLMAALGSDLTEYFMDYPLDHIKEAVRTPPKYACFTFAGKSIFTDDLATLSGIKFPVALVFDLRIMAADLGEIIMPKQKK